MNESRLRALFPQLLQENLMSFSNTTVPQHRHNSVDSPAIDAHNINTADGQGFVFGTGDHKVSIVYNPATNTFFIYSTVANDVEFSIQNFKDILIQANGTDPGDNVQVEYTDGTAIAALDLKATDASLIYTDGTDTVQSKLTGTTQEYIASGDFAVQLPTSTQPAPTIGMYSFDGASFKAVDGSGTFKFVPTSDATITAGAFTASGSITVTIDNTDFELLFR